MTLALVGALSQLDLVRADEVGVTFGESGALWEQVRVGDRPYSDFRSPEDGRLLDISGSRADALKTKVAALDASAPCKIERGKSRHDDEILTLENGLVKLVIVPALGGRIIELSNKATQANIFMDNYQHTEASPDTSASKPPRLPLGGWIEGVDDRDKNYWKIPHEVKVLTRTHNAIVVRTVGRVPNKVWGVAGTVTVERTIGIRRGSAHVSLRIRLTNNSGRRERAMRFRPHVRHALGSSAREDEFWLSSLGQVTFIPNHKGDLYCTVRAEEEIDTWQAILDRNEREGVVILPGGEISNRICIYGWPDLKMYTFENTSTLREHVVDGSTIEVRHDYAPILNFDAVTFANKAIAVEFVPEKRHFAPGETVQAIAGAARLVGKRLGEVVLRPKLEQSGQIAATLKTIRVAAPLLVAEPKTVSFSIPTDSPAGRYDLAVDVMVGGKVIGIFRHPVFLANRSGAFMSVLHPADDGYGKGLSMTGTRERAKVVIGRSEQGRSSGFYQIGTARLPWTTTVLSLGETLKVNHSVDFSKFPSGALLSSFGLCFPIRLGTDMSRPEQGAERLRQQYQKQLRVTVGSSFRDEQWFVDQARGSKEQEYQKPIPRWALSDTSDRFPKWRLGGTLQMTPTSAWIWKAADYDVAPTPVMQEVHAAGWVDLYSLLTQQGVLVYMPRMETVAPKEIFVDGAAGMVRVYLFPPHVPAMSLRKAGTAGKSRAEEWGLRADRMASFTFYVRFHSSDLAGYLPKDGNIARSIRRYLKSLKQ